MRQPGSALTRLATATVVGSSVVIALAWEHPGWLQWGARILVLAGASIAAAATYRAGSHRNGWVLYGVVIAASAAFASDLFGSRAAAQREKTLEEEARLLTKEIQAYRAATELLAAEHKMSQEEVRTKLFEAHQLLFDSLPREAEAWVDSFLETQPLRASELDARHDEQLEAQQQMMRRVPLVFEFLLEMFDNRIHVLKQRLARLEELSSNEMSEYFLPKGTQIERVTLREIQFENKQRVVVSAYPGVFDKEGFIVQYPSISFYEQPNRGRTTRSFTYQRSIGGGFGGGSISYPLSGFPLITESWKEAHAKRFDELLAIAMGRDALP